MNKRLTKKRKKKKKKEYMSLTGWWQANFSWLSIKPFLQKRQRGEKHQSKAQILKLQKNSRFRA